MTRRLGIVHYAKQIISPIILLSITLLFSLTPPLLAQETPTDLPAATETPFPTATFTETPSPTASETPTATYTAIPTETPTETAAATFTETATETATATLAASAVETPSLTPSATWTSEAIAPPLIASPVAIETTSVLAGEVELGVLDRDNFDRAQSLWTYSREWQRAFTGWGPALQIVNSKQPLEFSQTPLLNVAVQARVMMHEGSVRLAIRQSRAGSYSVVLSAQGQVDLYRGDALLQSVLIPAASTGGWHELGLAAIGNNLRVGLDGNEVIKAVDDAPLPPGTIAITGERSGGASILYVDSVEIHVPADELEEVSSRLPALDIAPKVYSANENTVSSASMSVAQQISEPTNLLAYQATMGIIASSFTTHLMGIMLSLFLIPRDPLRYIQDKSIRTI